MYTSGSTNGHNGSAPRISRRWYDDMEAVIRAVHHLPSYPLEYRISRARKRYAAYYDYSTPQRDRIAVSVYNATPHFSFAHEMGHFVDRRGLTNPAGGAFASRTSPTMEIWRKAIAESESYKELRRMKTVGSSEIQAALNYFMRPQELWARSYAQYIAVKSAHSALLTELQEIQAEMRDNLRLSTQWREEDFPPIIKAIDFLFKREGWLV